MGLDIYSNSLVSGTSVSADMRSWLLDEKESANARAAISAWPFYQLTPIHTLDGFSDLAHVGKVFAKNESARLPLKNFKMLGAVYALAKAVQSKNPALSLDEIFERSASKQRKTTTDSFRVVAATDGNHGTALAWAAQKMDVACSIYLPPDVSPGRERTIESLNAKVIRIDGSYDDAVHSAYRDAQKNGWQIIQDTALDGFEHHCLNIMYGYTTLIDEALNQLGDVRPTHVIMQAGVGGLAAAITSHLIHRYGSDRPKLITVESENAACVLASLKEGKRIAVAGPHSTLMGGIACGEVSEIAWDILHHTVDAAVSIDDAIAKETLKCVAKGLGPDAALEVGETGVAGLAALLAVSRNKDAVAQLGLHRNSVVLVFITEGITDPETYREFTAE